MAEQDPIPTEAVETELPIEPVSAPIPPNRPRKVYAGMWGPLEIVAVSLGAVTIVAAAMLYFLFVLPSNRELARNKSEAERLEAEQLSAKSKYGEITSTEAEVGKLLTSVDDFQTRFLPVSTNGQAALYQRLNGLIRAYGLVNTTGPDYAPLETIDFNPNQQTDEDSGIQTSSPRLRSVMCQRQSAASSMIWTLDHWRLAASSIRAPVRIKNITRSALVRSAS